MIGLISPEFAFHLFLKFPFGKNPGWMELSDTMVLLLTRLWNFTLGSLVDGFHHPRIYVSFFFFEIHLWEKQWVGGAWQQQSLFLTCFLKLKLSIKFGFTIPKLTLYFFVAIHVGNKALEC
jgi:hypothetical protein